MLFAYLACSLHLRHKFQASSVESVDAVYTLVGSEFTHSKLVSCTKIPYPKIPYPPANANLVFTRNINFEIHTLVWHDFQHFLDKRGMGVNFQTLRATSMAMSWSMDDIHVCVSYCVRQWGFVSPEADIWSLPPCPGPSNTSLQGT